MKKFVSSLILALTAGFAAFATPTVVKIGYSTENGSIFRINPINSLKSGIGYEYLQNVGVHAGIHYSYVYGSFPELYEKLLRNEIDLLPSVSMTEERKQKILFAEKPITTESVFLYTKTDNLTFQFKTVESLKGKKIGILENTYAVKFLEDYVRKNNLDSEIIYYKSNLKLHEDFDSNKLYAIADYEIPGIVNRTSILTLCSSNIYLAASKKNQKLIERIDSAVVEILDENPRFFYDLHTKQNQAQINRKLISKQELGWLIEHSTIKIGCLNNDLPYSTVDPQTGEPQGFLIEYVNNILRKFNYKNLIPKYSFYQTYDEMKEALDNGLIDIIFPVINDYGLGEQNNYYPTNPILSIYMSIIYKGNIGLNYLDKIAVPRMRLSSAYLDFKYPGTSCVVYENLEDCLDAVNRGIAKTAVGNSTKINSLLFKNNKYDNLKVFNLSDPCELSIGVSRQQPALLTLMNKIISGTSPRDTADLISKYTIQELRYTSKDFFASYMWLVILIFSVVVILALSLLAAVTKIGEYINYDPLTHLLNRKTLSQAYNQSRKKSEKTNEPFSIMIVDLDNFKQINDTYGHAAGDEVLKTVAKIISHGIKSNDYAFRWGGEEILIIFNTTLVHATNAAERIRKTIENTTVTCGKNDIHITATMGIATYTNGISFQDLFIFADDKLYKGKKNGKNQIVV